jgi:coenzyme F420-0:L-glutamate ligase / coenzyme F420-1:gamma-L-glutamate ligase
MVELPDELERFVRAQRVARLATVDARGRPHVVPIVFVYAASQLYTPIDAKPKSVPVRKLRRVRNILASPHVQVLLDRYDEDWSQLGFVQLRGHAELIERGDEHREAIGLLERAYPQYAGLPLEGRPIIRVTIESFFSWGRI